MKEVIFMNNTLDLNINSDAFERLKNSFNVVLKDTLKTMQKKKSAMLT